MTTEPDDARDQPRRLGLELGMAEHWARGRPPVANLLPDPAPARRGGLILLAAHTVFPEADLTILPAVAREEVTAGLRGPLRTTLADYQIVWPTTLSEAGQATTADADLTDLRSQLLHELSSADADIDAALQVAYRVHLARAVRGTVPMIVGVACLTWYGNYVNERSPSGDLFRTAAQLAERWFSEPPDRIAVEAAMTEFAHRAVGDSPPDLLDIPM